MSRINKPIPEFSVEAFHNGRFKTITSEDVKGRWSIFLFYPAAWEPGQETLQPGIELGGRI
ncbi:MAG: redoxin domain-containing protein [Gammaproteobacteria bacterium]|nr:redoxin domain-containing protein [Gammaproteobacteria bacterium]